MTKDGYPDDKELEYIKEFYGDYNELMDYVRDMWEYADYGRWEEADAKNNIMDPVREYRISTSGWSGNESIIYALQENRLFWLRCWFSTTRGGYYVFQVDKEE